MHRDSPTPFVDVRVQDGESLRVGELRFDILRRINEDPSLAFRMIETMSRRIRELSDEVVTLQTALDQRGDTGATDRH